MASTVHDVCVIGLGYIGLPTALVLSSKGLTVHGVDIDPKIIRDLSEGRIPISEPGLDSLLSDSLRSGNFSVSGKPESAKNFIIAVPTPLVSGETDKLADLSYIESALDSISPLLKGGELIINESTSPPGTTANIAVQIISQRPELSIQPNLEHSVYVAHCPERVIPGKTLRELRENSRVVGGINPESSSRASSLYEVFCEGELLVTDSTTAELTKLAENSFRDINIAFANELNDVSEHLGVSVWEVIELANRHPRVQILNPGPGVGGHCIAIDPWFIYQSAPEQSPIIRMSREQNNARPNRLAFNIVESIGGKDSSARICALGLAFKANVDDLRESPAVEVVKTLAKTLSESTIDVVEPHVDSLPLHISAYSNIALLSAQPVLDEYDAVVVLTDHEEFRAFQAPSSEKTHVFDTRGLWQR